MLRVIVESPYAAPTPEGVEANVAYARKAMLDSLGRGEAPYASHLLFPQVLDDADADQRKRGIEAGLLWGEAAAITAVYVDRGISTGMLLGVQAAAWRRTIEVRWIEGEIAPMDREFRPNNGPKQVAADFKAFVADVEAEMAETMAWVNRQSRATR
ncbi:hypothetical protein [Zavarzinia sp.]|jgi:hypothetical protein|uniref:DUF7768 domain-containing protein n=1 Tax=Zavarzinia sp. TaxID=2027920 RepID=UPI003568FE07